MGSENDQDGSIRILEARLSDLDSLSTILPRSFFPVNEVVKEALPDTPLMRNWWKAVYGEEINNPACYPLVALDAITETVVGVVCLRLIDRGDACGGFWTKHPWTGDHSKKIWGPPVDCMVEYEKRLMRGHEHYLLELLAVDHAFTGLGIGQKLVSRGCEIADQSGHSVFLQSGRAKDFYLKLGLGFKVEAEPTWEGYEARLLVRRVPKDC